MNLSRAAQRRGDTKRDEDIDPRRSNRAKLVAGAKARGQGFAADHKRWLMAKGKQFFDFFAENVIRAEINRTLKRWGRSTWRPHQGDQEKARRLRVGSAAWHATNEMRRQRR